MRTAFLLALMIFPQLCRASGDPGVVIWSAAALLYYIALAAVLMLAFRKGKSRLTDVCAFGLISLCSWWLYMNTTMEGALSHTLALLVIPTAFVASLFASQKQHH